MMNTFNEILKYKQNKWKDGRSSTVCVLCRKEIIEQDCDCWPLKGLPQVCPLAGIWDLGFQEDSHHSLIRMVHLALTACVDSMVYATYMHSFWRLEFYVLSREHLCDQPDKNPEHSVSVELPWQKFHICCHSSLLEDLSIFWEKTLRSVCLVFSVLCPICFFPLLILLWILPL